MTPEATRTLVQTTYRLRDAPVVDNGYGGLQPYKIVVETRGEKRRAVVYGRSDVYHNGGSVNFNIAGYNYKLEMPAWIQGLLRENGELT